MSLQLVQRCEQRPSAFVLEPQVTLGTARVGLELDPGLGDSVSLGRLLAGAESGRVGVVEPAAQHVSHAGRPLNRCDVPGERDQVAPEAVRGEHPGCALDVSGGQGCLEIRQPGVDAGLRQ